MCLIVIQITKTLKQAFLVVNKEPMAESHLNLNLVLASFRDYTVRNNSHRRYPIVSGIPRCDTPKFLPILLVRAVELSS